MLITYSSDNNARNSQSRLAAEAVNAALVLAHYRPSTSAVLAVGTTTTKATTGGNVTYMVNGSIFTKNATADLFSFGTATSGTLVAAGSIQRYAFLLDASGNPFTYESTQVVGTDSTLIRWSNVAGAGRWRPVQYWASLGYTLVGSVQITTDSTHTFTPGTTALNATGITAAFTNGLDASIVPLIGDARGQAIGAF